MHILTTIIPIFIVVLVGWLVQRRGFLPEAFVAPANRLVFYVAIPAMMFQAIVKSDLTALLRPGLILLTLAVAALTYAVAWLICSVSRIPRSSAGTFIQVSGHGNLGYIGLAVAFYYLGSEGLAHASVIAGFLMILQNTLSIVALQAHAPARSTPRKGKHLLLLRQLLTNPVIVSVLAGMLFSLLALPLPLVVARTLAILSGMALPLALLVIGASLSFDHMRAHLPQAIGATAVKVLLMPASGWLLFQIFGLPPTQTLPALILLASPTATITYIMAKEMQGNSNLASAAISISTLASVLTYIFWLQVGSS